MGNDYKGMQRPKLSSLTEPSQPSKPSKPSGSPARKETPGAGSGQPRQRLTANPVAGEAGPLAEGVKKVVEGALQNIIKGKPKEGLPDSSEHVEKDPASPEGMQRPISLSDPLPGNKRKMSSGVARRPRPLLRVKPD